MPDTMNLGSTADPALGIGHRRADHRIRARAAASDWPTITVLAFAAALALLLMYGEVRVLQADSYKALYDGRWIVHHGIPHTNYLSAVDWGGRWVDVEWLAEVLYYEIWRVGGLALVAIVSAVAVAAAAMILALLLRRRGVSVGWTMFFTACALLGLHHWGFIRAQDLAVPLFALLLFICLSDSERPRPGKRLLLLVPLLAVWANIHGSVLLGTALAVAYLLWRGITMARKDSLRSAAPVLALVCLTALAPLATPYGLRTIHYYLQFVDNDAQHVAGAEGRSPTFPGGSFFAVYGALLLVVIVAVRAVISRREAPWPLLGACVFTAVAAAGRLGNMPWHTMVTALLVAELTKEWLPVGRARPLPLMAVTALAVVIGVAVVANLSTRRAGSYESETATRATTAAAAWATEHPCWVILADNLDAAAMEWHDPQLAGQIAYDARAELYSEPTMMRGAVYELSTLPGWESTTTGYQLLLGSTGFRPQLVKHLATMRGGLVIAHDSRGIAVVNASHGAPANRGGATGAAPAMSCSRLAEAPGRVRR